MNLDEAVTPQDVPSVIDTAIFFMRWIKIHLKTVEG